MGSPQIQCLIILIDVVTLCVLFCLSCLQPCFRPIFHFPNESNFGQLNALFTRADPHGRPPHPRRTGKADTKLPTSSNTDTHRRPRRALPQKPGHNRASAPAAAACPNRRRRPSQSDQHGAGPWALNSVPIPDQFPAQS